MAVVPFVDSSKCKNYYRSYGLNEGHICAGGTDLVDTCGGDSGGPIGYRDIYNGFPRFIQFGVVSFGYTHCGEVNAPGVYANVSHYMQWITDNIKGASATPIIFKDDEGM